MSKVYYDNKEVQYNSEPVYVDEIPQMKTYDASIHVSQLVELVQDIKTEVYLLIIVEQDHTTQISKRVAIIQDHQTLINIIAKIYQYVTLKTYTVSSTKSPSRDTKVFELKSFTKISDQISKENNDITFIEL